MGQIASKIFARTGLDEKYYDEVAGLENENVRLCIDKFLQYQNSESWTQYILYRDLRRQFLSAALFPLPKVSKKRNADNEDEIESDFSKMKSLIEAKFLAATNSNELLKMMDDAKNKFVQTQPKLKVSISELNKVAHQKGTLSTEEIFAHG